MRLTVALAREMLAAAGVKDADVEAALQDGRAMDAWKAMVAAQGGDPDAELLTARETETVLADADGVLTTLDAYAVGVAAWRLGAGRARKEDPVQAVAGVTMHAKPGDEVRAGQPLLTLPAQPLARAPNISAVLPISPASLKPLLTMVNAASTR